MATAATGGTKPRERTPAGTFSANASTVDEASAQHRRLQNQCKKVEKDNEALNKQMRELKEKHKDELANVERIIAEKAVAEAKVQTLRDEMAELVRAQARPRAVTRRAATDSERTRDRHGAVFNEINNEAFEQQAKADAIEWFLQRNPDIIEGILQGDPPTSFNLTGRRIARCWTGWRIVGRSCLMGCVGDSCSLWRRIGLLSWRRSFNVIWGWAITRSGSDS
jgi:hypothetical protein